MRPSAAPLFSQGRPSLRVCVAASVGLALVINALIFGLGYGDHPAGEPDGGPINRVIEAVVPFVWLGLFGSMGAAFWRLQHDQPRVPGAAWAVLVLVLNCAAYPAYTLGFQSRDLGMAGNAFTALLAAGCIGASWRRSRLAALAVTPVLVWVSLASVGLYAAATGRQF